MGWAAADRRMHSAASAAISAICHSPAMPLRFLHADQEQMASRLAPPPQMHRRPSAWQKLPKLHTVGYAAAKRRMHLAARVTEIRHLPQPGTVLPLHFVRKDLEGNPDGIVSPDGLTPLSVAEAAEAAATAAYRGVGCCKEAHALGCQGDWIRRLPQPGTAESGPAGPQMRPGLPMGTPQAGWSPWGSLRTEGV